MKPWRTLLGLLVAAALAGLFLPHLAASNPILATVVVGPLPRSLVADEATGRVFVSTVAKLGTVVVLDSTSGARVHTTALGVSQNDSGVGAPSVYLADSSGQHVNASLQDGTLFALDPASGAIRRRWPAHWVWPPWPVGGHPAHGLVWDENNTLLVEDVATRRVVAHVPLGQDGADYEAAQTTQRLYLSTATGEISTMDAYRGVVLHTVQTSAAYYPWFALSEPTRHLFVFSDTDTLQMVDSMTGRVQRTIHAAVGAPPTAASPPFSQVFEVSPRGDQLWVSNPERQTLSVFATATGALLYTARVGPTPMAMVADPRHQHLLVLCRGAIDLSGNPLTYGSLSVLDSRTGRVERTVPVGAAPVEIAIDTRTSRAFILNANVDPDMLPVHLQRPQDAGTGILAGLHRWLPFLPDAPAATDQGSVTVLDTNSL